MFYNVLRNFLVDFNLFFLVYTLRLLSLLFSYFILFHYHLAVECQNSLWYKVFWGPLLNDADPRVNLWLLHTDVVDADIIRTEITVLWGTGINCDEAGKFWVLLWCRSSLLKIRNKKWRGSTQPANRVHHHRNNGSNTGLTHSIMTCSKQRCSTVLGLSAWSSFHTGHSNRIPSSLLYFYCSNCYFKCCPEISTTA